MKELRKGILLAKNDFKKLALEAKRKDLEEEIVTGMLEVLETTEKIILGGSEDFSDLTVEAYCRTMEGLKERSAR